MKVILQIESGYDRREVAVENEISFGRSDASNIVLGDSGLSRKNTSFFIDEGEVFVADEGSLNGTFLNGEKIAPPRASYLFTVKEGSVERTFIRHENLAFIYKERSVLAGKSGVTKHNIRCV